MKNLLLIIAAVGIISFLLISSTLPLGGLIGELNPKTQSHAQTVPGVGVLGDSNSDEYRADW